MVFSEAAAPFALFFKIIIAFLSDLLGLLPKFGSLILKSIIIFALSCWGWLLIDWIWGIV
ncbi:hypothetical protein [Mesomycoplasma hyopneumoniae]|uniref:hypothetical protein n=1 Tax=Mesomycoplasma hyopneumoniae TaxID=2099 RepID=UPI003DA63480